ncbi:MAG: hypothetical protein K0S37_3839 [Microbacterium sp.]|nr:hypothetical protein [Microbacterium sp.]
MAIALVLLRHAWPEKFGSAGIVGVVAFFALSGYLITGLLLSDINRRGRVRYGRFYRNRALRLLPPLVLMLAVLAVVTLVADPLGQREGLARALVIGITYTGNLPIDLGSSAIDHLWTLATEEQFYLVWPLILTFAIRRGRMRTVILTTSAALILVVAATIVLTYPDVHRIYRLPTSWALAMIIGAAARIWNDRLISLLPIRPGQRAAVGAVAFVALLALSMIPEGKASPWSYFLLGPAVAVIAVVLMQIWSDWRSLPSPALRPLLALGTISYAAYLWNYPIVLWTRAASDAWWVPVATIVLTILAATVSWWTVEVPAQRWRARMDAKAKQTARTADLAPSSATE